MYKDVELEDVLQDIDYMLESIEQTLAKAEKANDEYLYWKKEVTRTVGLINEGKSELSKYKISLASMEEAYREEQKARKQILEQSITSTVNAWYDGAEYDFLFEQSGSTRAPQTYLVDRITDSDIETVCGDSSAQVIGLLCLNAIIVAKDSNFLFLDEAFSNTDAITATQIGELVSAGINGIQTIVIENKAEVVDTIKEKGGLRYNLKYDKADKCTHIISIDDLCHIIPEDNELYKLVKEAI